MSTTDTTSSFSPTTVAVVVPLSLRPTLTPDEEVSYRHIVHYLGRYDKFMIAPRSLWVKFPEFRIIRFDDRFFGSGEAHTRLMLSPRFYETFHEYQYILLCHLDALPLSDRLIEWCAKGYDYVGAPWIRCDDLSFLDVPRVGCGGFSLRKISGFLKVMYSPEFEIDPREYWHRFRETRSLAWRLGNYPRKYLKRFHYFNNARRYLARWHGKNEDLFWADEAAKYHPGFRIPSVEVALDFAFEAAPRICFEMNGGKLPFGCHAWPRYDRAFWEPYLLNHPTASAV